MSFFDTLIILPMLNFLLWLYGLVGNFILAIVIFTILTRLIILPSTISQQKNTQKMSSLQPQIKEIQDKYKNDPQKMNEELNKIGWNPGMMLGGCLPLILQLVILMGLWQAIQRVLATSPLDLLNLAGSIYKWAPNLLHLLPVNHTFLWLDLSQHDPTYILPILVAASTYFSQKAYQPATAGADDQSAAMARQMQIIMPIMLGYFALNFPSALSIYWVFTNFLAVAQYYALQKSGLVPMPRPAPARSAPRAAQATGITDKSSAPPPSEPISKSKPASRARKVRTTKKKSRKENP